MRIISAIGRPTLTQSSLLGGSKTLLARSLASSSGWKGSDRFGSLDYKILSQGLTLPPPKDPIAATLAKQTFCSTKKLQSSLGDLYSTMLDNKRLAPFLQVAAMRASKADPLAVLCVEKPEEAGLPANWNGSCKALNGVIAATNMDGLLSSTLVHELGHLVLSDVFVNALLPFSEEEADLMSIRCKYAVKDFMRAAEKCPVSYWSHTRLDAYEPEERMIELVPHMLIVARFGSEGEKWLEKNCPDAWAFLVEDVIPRIEAHLKANQPK